MIEPMVAGATLIVSGFAFLVAAFGWEISGSAISELPLYGIGTALLLLAGFILIVEACWYAGRGLTGTVPSTPMADLDSELTLMLAIPRRAAWRTEALNYAQMLYNDIRADCDTDTAVIAKESLARAAQEAGARTKSIVAWFTGSQRESTWAALHATEEQLLLIQPPDTIRGRIPGMRVALRNTLPAEDPRLGEYLESLKDIEAPDRRMRKTSRQRLLRILRDINFGSAAAHANVRAERNILLEVGFVAIAFLVLVSVTNKFSSRFIDLKATPVDQGPKTWWVVVMGLLGGVIGALATKYRVRGTAADDNSLPTVQTLIRIPTGGVVALGAVILVQSGFVSALKAQTSLQLLGIALVVGYTPDLALKYLDKKLDKVTDEARGKDDPERPTLASPAAAGPPAQ
jgi:hypothetical protein